MEEYKTFKKPQICCRFAFSVLWEMTKEAEIVKTDFTKSIILSKVSLVSSARFLTTYN